jgi:hypothetical protein
VRPAETLRAVKRNSRVWQGGAARALAGSLLAAGVSQAAMVVSGVLVARALGPADRGYIAIVIWVPALLALVGSLGLPLASTYFVARSPESAQSIARKLIVPALLQTATAVAIMLGALVTVLSGEPARVISAGLVATVLVPAILAQTYGLALLQGQRRFRAFNVLRVGPAVLYSIAVLGAFVAGLHSLLQITVVTVAANVVAAGLTIIVLLRGLVPRRDIATAAGCVGPGAGQADDGVPGVDHHERAAGRADGDRDLVLRLHRRPGPITPITLPFAAYRRARSPCPSREQPAGVQSLQA